MGLKKTATESEIKKEFYKLAKKYHPDARENKECKKSEEKFKQVSEAYEVLSNKDMKSQYDSAR